MALTLIKPEYDQWGPGEHNGTFRGNNPAFVTAAHTLRHWWSDDTLERETIRKGEKIEEAFAKIVKDTSGAEAFQKGRGMARGLQFGEPDLADKVAATAFEHGLLLETAGPDDEVLKLLPPLTITDDELDEGLAIVAESVRAVTGS